ncbi:hypothetical protein SAMN04515666_101323 [Bosea lupini]|uniref:Uncharacterized protein n=1 Tax=Bosea lupini TaxID=1036779 RepID=A0A1H7GD81_9HYPH|nr:hypothetical protein [Bosea lupini]SEK36109.1 hypothetical protein SAMN04515666_101323 [Bosea lupini]
MTERDLFPVLWDDHTDKCAPQRHLVHIGEETGTDEYLLVDGRPGSLTKVMGPLSYEEGVRFAERLLRDGIVTESDMARALCVCMVLVACTRPPEQENVSPRLTRIEPEMRQRIRAVKTEAA